MTLFIIAPPRDAGAAGERIGQQFGGRCALLAYLLGAAYSWRRIYFYEV
jgi:hypothetical protein